MSRYVHQVAMVAPVSVWPQAAAMLEALGWSLGDGVPLSASGAEPATHRGIYTRLTEEQIAIATGQVVPRIEGADAADVQAVIEQLIVRRGPAGTEQWFAALLEAGLQIVQAGVRP